MNFPLQIFASLLLACAIGACSRPDTSSVDPAAVRAKLAAIPLDQKVHLTNAEWQAIMPSLQFYVMRRGGTERPSNSGNIIEQRTGTYVCSACGNPLYAAETKFNSGTGWPSFYQPLRREAVREAKEVAAIFGTEISCARCRSHLGHVFNDGPPPTGLRYCMNAVALRFVAGAVTPAARDVATREISRG